MSLLRLQTDVLCKQAQRVGDFTHQAIAIRAGVEQSTITRLLAGRTVPTVATLIALRRAYGVSLDDLLPTTEVDATDAKAAAA